MNRIYHLCLKESEIPGNHPLHNAKLQNEGATVSLKWRRGPIFKEDAYLVFWYEEGKVYFSRVNPVLHGLDASFFKDGHEMVECRNWNEFTKKMVEFREKGYVTEN